MWNIPLALTEPWVRSSHDATRQLFIHEVLFNESLVSADFTLIMALEGSLHFQTMFKFTRENASRFERGPGFPVQLDICATVSTPNQTSSSGVGLALWLAHFWEKVTDHSNKPAVLGKLAHNHLQTHTILFSGTLEWLHETFPRTKHCVTFAFSQLLFLFAASQPWRRREIARHCGMANLGCAAWRITAKQGKHWAEERDGELPFICFLEKIRTRSQQLWRRAAMKKDKEQPGSGSETQLHPNNPLTRVTKQSHMLLVSIQRPGELLYMQASRERWTWQHHQDVKMCQTAEAGWKTAGSKKLQAAVGMKNARLHRKWQYEVFQSLDNRTN